MVRKQAGVGRKAAGTARKRAANGRFQSSGRVAAEEGAQKAPEKKKRPIKDVEEYADREFRREFPEIFDGLCEKAKDGGVQQARLLQQWSKTGDGKTAKRRGKSLSEMLLDELKRRQDEREAAAEMAAGERERSSEGATSGGDQEKA